MKKTLTLFIILIIYYSDLTSQVCAILPNQGDLTSIKDTLGNVPNYAGFTANNSDPTPGQADRRCRNIWDLEIYNDKVFVGYGSTVDNAGPLDLWTYNPYFSGNKWNLEVQDFPTEAFERFRVSNNQLLVPNADEIPNVGHRFAYYNGSKWGHVYDESFNGVYHVRDIQYYNGWYYMVGNQHGLFRRKGLRPNPQTEYDIARNETVTSPSCNGVDTSSPFGDNEDSETDPTDEDRTIIGCNFSWAGGIFNINNKLIVPSQTFQEYVNPNLDVANPMFMQVDGDNITWSEDMNNPIKHQHFYPIDNTTNQDLEGQNTFLRPFEQVSLQGKHIYTLRSYEGFNDAITNFGEPYHFNYNNSKGMFFKTGLRARAQKVIFPDNSAVGEDLLIQNGHVYALANTKLDRNNFSVKVYRNQGNVTATSWVEVFRFESPNMARSFEYHDGYFYFGLGANRGDNTNDAGQLLRFKVCNSQNLEIGESSPQNIGVYPNPVSDRLFVDIENFEDYTITLVDVTGRELMKINNKSVDVSTLQNGSYFLRIENTMDKTIQHEKITVMH